MGAVVSLLLQKVLSNSEKSKAKKNETNSNMLSGDFNDSTLTNLLGSK